MVQPDEFSFAGLLKACSRQKRLREVEQIHCQILKFRSWFGSKALVENGLVHMYASCGEMRLAHRVFDEMGERSVITWNSMFSAYVKSRLWEEVVGLFNEMLKMGDAFDEVTLISVLIACGKLRNLELGQWIYDYVEKSRLMGKSSLLTSLFDLYAKCGHVDAARRLFDTMPKKDVVAWSAMSMVIPKQIDARKHLLCSTRCKRPMWNLMKLLW